MPSVQKTLFIFLSVIFLNTQASVASINSLGRGEGLENSIKAGITAATSEDALKGAFTSIFTAGANNSLGITGEGFANNMYRTGVSTTINTGINGGDLADNLLKAYTTALIDIGAKKGANWIGDRYALNSYTGGIGSKNYWIHKGLHAGLGCATASAKGQDCASGAMGGVSGEMFAEIIGDNRNLSDAEILAYSRVAIGFMAQATGHDVNAADGTASNAIQNNYLTHREATKRTQLREKCAKSEPCSQSELDEMAALDDLDIQRDSRLIRECTSDPTSSACTTETLQFIKAQKTFDEEIGKLTAKEKEQLFTELKQNPSGVGSVILERLQSQMLLGRLAENNRVLTSKDPNVISQIDYATRIATIDISGLLTRLSGGSPRQADTASWLLGIGAITYGGTRSITRYFNRNSPSTNRSIARNCLLVGSLCNPDVQSTRASFEHVDIPNRTIFTVPDTTIRNNMRSSSKIKKESIFNDRQNFND